MRIATIALDGSSSAAVVDGDRALELAGASSGLESVREIAAGGQRALDRVGEWAVRQRDEAWRPIAGLRLGPAVPDPGAILQAVVSGRAAVGGGTILTMTQLAGNSGGKVQVVAEFDAPDFTKGYSAYAFRRSDMKSRDAFEAVMKTYLGTPEMMKAAASNKANPRATAGE